MTTYKSQIKTIIELSFGESVTDISEMFKSCPNLTNDFEIPSHITNCTNTFKDCVSMTHIHSNWDNSYTGEIISTDCYAGCIGITHIDNENVISYEGDLGLDYIPLDWGGNGFTLDCTMIYELDITDKFLNKPLKPIGVKSLLALNESVAKVNWGDGSPAELLCVNGKITEHTYTTKGTYFVKAHASMGHGYSAQFGGAISKILQVPKYEYGRINSMLAYACSGASNMTYADFSNLAYEKGVTKFNVAAMFFNCNKLKTVIIPSDWIIEYCHSMFSGCQSLESVDFLKDWDVSNVKDMNGVFSNCTSITDIDLSSWDVSKVTNMSNMFNRCSSLSYLNITGWDFTNVTSVYNMFANAGLKTIDTSTWLNTSNITNFANFCNGATTEYITLTFSGSMWAIMHNCRNVKHVTWKNCTVSIENYSFPSFAPKTGEWQITFDNAIISAENGTRSILRDYSHLTVESLMSVINALADRTGMDSDTLTIGSANLTKLTPEQIKIATDKNWTVV